MAKQYWKRLVPTSLVKALQLCKEHGIKENNMSVERIADHLGTNAELVYKHLALGKLPVNKIIPFEQACGINFVTQYIAHSQGYLLVKAPTGRKAENKDLTDLQLFMTEVAALMIKFQQDKSQASDTIDAIKVLMQDLAFHQNNVAKTSTQQNELEID